MIKRQSGSKTRRTAKILIALGLGCTVSVLIAELRGEPPKVQIKFQRGSSPEQAPPPPKSSPKSPATSSAEPNQQKPPLDGKLAADISRSSAGQTPSKLDTSVPLTVAMDEEKNQQIAPDWKDPKVVFFVTGKQLGYIEPCGCTGLENQKGGLNRRDTLLALIKKRGWNVVAIDGGGQVRRKGKQSDIKFNWSATAFNLLEYQASTFGEDDLNLTWDSLVLSMIDNSGNKNGLFLSSNVSVIPDYDTSHKVIVVDNKRIGITGVLGDENAKKVDNDNIKIAGAIASLRATAEKLKEAKCDYMVLISHASLEETRAMAQAVPEFSLVITSGGYGEPTFRPEWIEGTKSQMVQVGVKGMYVGLFGLFDDPKEPFRYQRIALSSQFEDSARVTELFGKYQDELKTIGMEGLGTRPMSHPSTRDFVGTEKCGECHTTAYDIWKNTPHAHATDSIVEPPERSMARHFDPECLSCHVTGWNPQSFYPYRTGYESLTGTPHMVGSGCENCHGPGSQHTAAELGEIEASAELKEKLREDMRLPLEKASDKCLECHDIDNSPDFHKPDAFDLYWEKVKHYGKD